MILLDTFCKAGGAGMGYHQAGFEVVGVDKEAQPNYPFRFIQADAVQYILDEGHRYDVIHASPPCHKHSRAGKACTVTLGKEYEDLIAPTRQALEAVGKPYVIENVPTAPLRPDLRLYGYAFGLPLIRERWFELGNGIWSMCPQVEPTRLQVSTGDLVTVAGHGSLKSRRRNGKKMVHDVVYKHCKGSIVANWSHAMGIDWMKTTEELANAIPPAYTKYIGQLIIEQIFRHEHNNNFAASIAATK